MVAAPFGACMLTTVPRILSKLISLLYDTVYVGLRTLKAGLTWGFCTNIISWAAQTKSAPSTAAMVYLRGSLNRVLQEDILARPAPRRS